MLRPIDGLMTTRRLSRLSLRRRPLLLRVLRLTSYWATGDVAQHLIIGVHVDVTAVTGTNPTAAFVVQVAPDTGAFGSPVSVGEVATAVGVGSFTIDVDRDDIINALGANPTAGSLRLYATLGGTSPSFTYVAYVSPVAGM